MNRINISKRAGGKKQLGQGMTEYIIIVALVAIGAIGVYSAFGHTVQSQMAAVSNGLAGQGGPARAAITKAGAEANKATAASATDIGLDNFAQNVEKQ